MGPAIAAALDDLARRFEVTSALRETWPTVRAFLQNGGKRIRPRLFLGSFELFGDQSSRGDGRVTRVAVALEFFHAFALVHDDVIDASCSRRGEPTLHKRLERMALDKRQAEGMAIVIGDILFGFAMECILGSGMPATRSQRALTYFLGVAQETGAGQAAEIAALPLDLAEISEADIRAIYHSKTTRYTIEAPLVMGAYLGGASAQMAELLQSFARPLGLAFQIRNDLHEMEQIAACAPQAADDLNAGVKTLFLKRLHDRLPVSQRGDVQHCLRMGSSREAQACLARLIQQTSLTREFAGEVEALFNSAYEQLVDAELPPVTRESLWRFVEQIRHSSHHSEAPELVARTA